MEREAREWGLGPEGGDGVKAGSRLSIFTMLGAFGFAWTLSLRSRSFLRFCAFSLSSLPLLLLCFVLTLLWIFVPLLCLAFCSPLFLLCFVPVRFVRSRLVVLPLSLSILGSLSFSVSRLDSTRTL